MEKFSLFGCIEKMIVGMGIKQTTKPLKLMVASTCGGSGIFEMVADMLWHDVEKLSSSEVHRPSMQLRII